MVWLAILLILVCLLFAHNLTHLLKELEDTRCTLARMASSRNQYREALHRTQDSALDRALYYRQDLDWTKDLYRQSDYLREKNLLLKSIHENGG